MITVRLLVQCKELYTCVKESMDKAATRNSSRVAGESILLTYLLSIRRLGPVTSPVRTTAAHTSQIIINKMLCPVLGHYSLIL